MAEVQRYAWIALESGDNRNHFLRASPLGSVWLTAVERRSGLVRLMSLSDTDDGLDGGDVPRKKFSGKKLVLFIILPLLLLLLVGAALYFSGVLDAMNEPPEVVEEPQEPEQVIFFDVPDQLVNLNTDSRRATYLKISISLEVGKPSDVEKLNEVMPRILDNFQVYLRELTMDDLRGSAGMYRLREELLVRVSAAAHPVRIKDVLFREMLIQ